MQEFQLTLRRELCRRSYYDFFREFWDQIEPEKLAENWHVRYLCDELQQIGEQIFLRTDDKTGESYREPLRHNLIVNISPGESKSSICTIFFPVWLWVNDPTIRVITVSYSDSLSRNHAQKSRDIIDSPKFQETFGHLFQLRKRDQNKKTEYGIVTPNGVSGGVRFATSVGASITGKHAHAIICLPYDQDVITDQGPIKIGEIVDGELPVNVLSFNHETNDYEFKRILKYEKNPSRRIIQVETESGLIFKCTEDHLVYTVENGYIEARYLTDNHTVVIHDEAL